MANVVLVLAVTTRTAWSEVLVSFERPTFFVSINAGGDSSGFERLPATFSVRAMLER